MTKRILIVDDEKNIALTLKELLALKGYDVQAVFTGTGAIERLGQGDLDLILLDIQMPDISGVEILRQAKKNYPDIKTVVLSGFLEEYDREIEEIGCNAFLNKPFSIKTLIRLLDSVLLGRKRDKEYFSALIEDPAVLAKADLLFVEPNEIMYSSKLAYFRDPGRSMGEYKLTPAFTEQEVSLKLRDFRPNIVLSDISMFRLYKLNDKFAKAQSPPEDVILYGLRRHRDVDGAKGVSFISGFFDPITAVAAPGEMDKLGRIVRATAIAHDLYVKLK